MSLNWWFFPRQRFPAGSFLLGPSPIVRFKDRPKLDLSCTRSTTLQGGNVQGDTLITKLGCSAILDYSTVYLLFCSKCILQWMLGAKDELLQFGQNYFQNEMLWLNWGNDFHQAQTRFSGKKFALFSCKI